MNIPDHIVETRRAITASCVVSEDPVAFADEFFDVLLLSPFELVGTGDLWAISVR
jgi:hypothetical protein